MPGSESGYACELEESWDIVWFHSGCYSALEHDRESNPQSFWRATNFSHEKADFMVLCEHDLPRDYSHWGRLSIGDNPDVKSHIWGKTFPLRLQILDEGHNHTELREVNDSFASRMWKQIFLESWEYCIYLGSTEDDDENPFILIDLELKEDSARLVMKKRKVSEGGKEVPYKKLTPSEREKLGYGLTASGLNPSNHSPKTASKLLDSLHVQAREMVRTISELRKCDGMDEPDDLQTIEEYLEKSRELISSRRFDNRINTARETKPQTSERNRVPL